MTARSVGLVATILVALGLLAFIAGCASPAATPAATLAAKPTTGSAQVAPTAAPAAQPAATKPAAAAAQPAPTAASAATPVAQPTGNLRVVVSTLNVQTLDPMLDNGPGKIYLVLLYDSIVNMTPQLQVSRDNGLSTGWEASADKKTWTFTLRKGVKFHNGDELTSADVKYSIERNIGPQSKTPFAPTFRNMLASIEAPTPNTVVFNLKQPNGLLDHLVSVFVSPDAMIVPKKYIEEKGEENFRTRPVGTGPYRFVEQKPGYSITFEAVDNHWTGIVPKFKTITFTLVPEEATRVAMLKSGQADIIDTSRAKTKELSSAGLKVYSSAPDTIVGAFLELMWDKTSYLADKRVREALNMAVNRQEVLQTLFMGQGNVSNTMYYGTNNAGYEAVAPYPYDPARAKQLIAEAFPNGVSLTLNSLPRPGVGELGLVNEALAGYWEKIGVKVKLNTMEMAAWQDAKRAQRMVNTVTGFTVINQPLPATTMSALLASSAPLTTVKEPEMDKLLDAANSPMDLAQAGQTYRALGKYIRDNSLGVGIAEVGTVYGTAANVPKWDPGKIQYLLNLVLGFQ